MDENERIIGRLQDRQSQMESERGPHEVMWRAIADWIFPRRTFEMPKSKGALRKRVMVDTTAITANERAAAMLYGFMINPYQPWLRPHLADREPEQHEKAYLEDDTNRMFRFLSGARSTWRTAGIESYQDDTAFGNSAIFAGRSERSGRPFYKALPLMECFWIENEEGVVDTFHRRFTLSLKDAAALYPKAKGIQKKLEGAKRDPARLLEKLEFIRAAEPREGGIAGSMATNKPVASIILCKDTRELVQVSGYDSFPYSVTRMQKRAGDSYGVGFGWTALPLAKLLNALMESIVRNAESNADPALFDTTGKIRSLDRRPGALNRLNVSDMGLVDPQHILRRVQEAGDVTISADLVTSLRSLIQEVFYVDWMIPAGDGARVTAEWVREKRDVRLRSMAPIVARGEQEKLTVIGDRTYQMMQAAGMLSREIPESLAGEDIDFEYTSPLAMAQKLNELEVIDTSFALLERGALLDPGVVDEYDVSKMVDAGMEARGAAAGFRRSPEDARKRREDRERAQQMAQGLEQAETAARAAASAGQGAANLAQAGAG